MTEFNSGVSSLFNQCYVISLPNRINYINDTLSKMNIKFTLFNAILGKNLNMENMILQGIVSKNNDYLNNNMVACALSHLEVIKLFYKSSLYDDDSCLIFEDDIVLDLNHSEKLIKSMENIPKDWDMINFGRCGDNCNKDIKINKHIIKSTDPRCTHSYALTRKCAKIIIDNIYPIKEQVDWFYVRLKNEGKIKLYSSSPRIYHQLKTFGIGQSSLGNNDSASECHYIEYNFYNKILVILVFLILIYIYIKNKKVIKKFIKI